jgi:hypothetical protein
MSESVKSAPVSIMLVSSGLDDFREDCFDFPDFADDRDCLDLPDFPDLPDLIDPPDPPLWMMLPLLRFYRNSYLDANILVSHSEAHYI